MGGEKVIWILMRLPASGSPRVGGEKRCAGTRSQGACRDHPMGGEKMNKRYEEGRKPGSPPRRRGKGPMLCHRCQVLGITPRGRGKSGRSCGQTSASRDHPRVGGEKCTGKGEKGEAAGSPRVGGEKRFSAVFQRATSGSPPHGRGKMHLSLTLAHDTLHALTQFFNRVAFVDKLQNRSE